MDPMQGFFGAVLGAALGSAIVGVANWFLQNKVHQQALELQENQRKQDQSAREAQWEQERIARETQWHWEARMRHDDWTNAQADRKAEWDRQRQDRLEQLEEDRRLEREREQREALREPQLLAPRFSQAARAMFEHEQERYRAQQEGKEPEALTPDNRLRLEAFVEQFNDLRYTVIAAITRIDSEKIRQIAGNLYVLEEDMALSMPESWAESNVLYGGRSPIQLQVDWQRQLLRMAGKLLRGDSVEDETIEDNVHQQRT